MVRSCAGAGCPGAGTRRSRNMVVPPAGSVTLMVVLSPIQVWPPISPLSEMLYGPGVAAKKAMALQSPLVLVGAIDAP